MIVAPASTSISVDVFFADDTGAAVTGKVAADFPVCKWSGGSNTADTTITLSDLAAITTAHPNDNTAGGIKEREGGWYRLDLPNNAISAAGRKTLTFAETTNKRILAPPIDCQYLQSNVIQIAGTAQTGRDIGASVLLAASQHVIVDSGTVTTLTNLPSIPANWITATGITAAALNGKGDWSTYAGGDTSGTMTLLSRLGGAISLSAGAVTVGTNNDKTGYALSAAGLDSISIADPGVAANLTTFPKIMVWLFRRFFAKADMTTTHTKTYADDGTTVNVTQTVSDDGTTQTQGKGA